MQLLLHLAAAAAAKLLAKELLVVLRKNSWFLLERIMTLFQNSLLWCDK